MTSVPTYSIPRDAKLELFGDGPWLDEPDELEWLTAGLPCVAVRNLIMGHWCGYVGIPPSHPLYGKGTRFGRNLHVHGEITYASEEDPGRSVVDAVLPEPNTVWWWLGFDCGHAYDLIPRLEKHLNTYPYSRTYHTLSYVREECDSLARQLRALALPATSDTECGMSCRRCGRAITGIAPAMVAVRLREIVQQSPPRPIDPAESNEQRRDQTATWDQLSAGSLRSRVILLAQELEGLCAFCKTV